MGLWKGKKGSSVFYKITNSNSAQKQGIRERVYEVSNPKTAAQADQRMKLLPAQRIAGVLREIIERGWQGIDYGAKSRSAFLSKALSMSSGFPYVDKDSDLIVPGKYQITKGTLTQIVSRVYSFDGISAPALTTNLYIGSDLDIVPATTTVGTLSTALLANNSGLQEGDQITFVICFTNDYDISSVEDMDYFWKYFSFFIDSSSTTIMQDVSAALYSSDPGDSANSLNYNEAFINASGAVLAGCVILSRLGSTGTYLRSTAKLNVDDGLDAWFTQSKKQKARRSYQYKGANDEPTDGPDWPVDSDVDYETTYESEFTIQSVTSSTYNNAIGQTVKVRRRISDEDLVAVYVTTYEEDATNLVTPSGQALTVTIPGTTPAEVTGVPVSAVAVLANLPQITYEG